MDAFYGGRGQQGGGGSSPGGRGGGGAAAGGAAAADGSAKRTQPLRALTIKQLTTAQQVGEGVMVIDGAELGQATVVGRVIELDAQQGATPGTAKSHGYKISDGSGVINVRHWIDAGAPEELQQPVGTFVRCTGSVKSWQGKPLITGSVRPITSTSEAQYHLLDAILTHLRLTQGHRQIPGTGGGASSATPSATMIGGGVNMAMVPLPDAILRLIETSGKRTTGASLDQICSGLQHQFNGAEVRDTVRAMLAEGKIFALADNRYGF